MNPLSSIVRGVDVYDWHCNENKMIATDEGVVMPHGNPRAFVAWKDFLSFVHDIAMDDNMAALLFGLLQKAEKWKAEKEQRKRDAFMAAPLYNRIDTWIGEQFEDLGWRLFTPQQIAKCVNATPEEVIAELDRGIASGVSALVKTGEASCVEGHSMGVYGWDERPEVLNYDCPECGEAHDGEWTIRYELPVKVGG